MTVKDLSLLFTLVLTGVARVLIAVGWRNRLRRQSDVEPLPEVPAELGAPLAAADGQYVASTTAGTFAAHEAKHSIEEFIKDSITTDPTGVKAITVLTLGALGFAIYQAIKTPLHWLAECCFGVEKETVNDKIGAISFSRMSRINASAVCAERRATLPGAVV